MANAPRTGLLLGNADLFINIDGIVRKRRRLRERRAPILARGIRPALENQAHRVERVADIVQCGPNNCKVLRIGQIELLSWLAALDDFRNWLIREAA